MRRLLLLLLLGAASAQGGRTIDEILDGHARMLGAVMDVHTLRARLDTGDGRATARGAETVWRLPGACVRTIPVKDHAPLHEYFGPEGAFISRGIFERWRPNQETTRGGYYFLKALAEPFPLRPYLANARLQRGLRKAQAAGRDVLFGPPDDHGVRAVYLLHPRTHMLDRVRYEREPNRPLAEVRYGDFRSVAGVMLPHTISATFYMRYEDGETSRLKLLPAKERTESIRRWEVNPDLSGTVWTPPGRSKRGAAGFERTVHPTGPNPFEVAAGDFDGDGAADFAAACDGGLFVHFQGEERPRAIPLARGQCRGLAAEDLDCDGRFELITTSNVHPARTFFIVSFDAERTPEIRSMYGAPSFTHSLVTTDFDLDGVPDWACTGYEGARELSVKYGNGALGIRRTGTIWPLNPDRKARRGMGLAVGNVDGNRFKDIAVADGRRVVVFLGQVTGGFRPGISIPREESPRLRWRPVGVAFADLDHNGRDDLLVVSERPGPDFANDLFVILNRRDRLAVVSTHRAGHRVQAVATGWFNGDAHPDVAVTSLATGEVFVLFGDGKGGLAKPVPLASGRGTCRLAVADIDGDGSDDIVAANRLDDTVTVLGNRDPGARGHRPPPARARATPPPTEAEFRLEGLTDPFEFAGEFRLPADIEDPSGIECIGGDGAHTQIVLVSDKRPALFRAVLDRTRKRLLVGPAIPLQGAGGARLDLEGIAFDHPSGNLFLACEADSHILRVSLFGHVLDRVKTEFEEADNDGLEAVAVRRLKDGTPLLYVFKERIGMTRMPPPVHVYGFEEDPFALAPIRTDLTVPGPVVDQTGATVFGDKMFVVHRLARTILEFKFDGEGFAQEAKRASYIQLAADLGLRSPKRPLFGMVEGLAVDPVQGDLFLLVDNNREKIGLKGRNRGREGRLLWFRNRGVGEGRTQPARVEVRQIRVAFAGALKSAGIERDRAAAAARAREVLERAQAGEDFEALVRAFHDAAPGLPPEMRLVINALDARPGEIRQGKVPAALGRLAFNLEVGEIDLCAFHHSESPYGWHIVTRVR